MAETKEMYVKPFSQEGFTWKRLEEQALLEAEKAKPSSEPAHWAKCSCTACYGRGVTGKIAMKIQGTTMQNEQLCWCAKRNFVRWRDVFVRNYVAQHKDEIQTPA